MERKLLNKKSSFPKGEITIGGSKSETNRLLILNQLYGTPLEIKNLSDSEDTQTLRQAFSQTGNTIDVGHAGTAMRFLTAFFAIQENREIILTGSQRMKQRPIGILVEALNQTGADITYLENEGYPPIQIRGKKLNRDFVELDAGVSSQFVTSLLLIAPSLEHGLTIQLNGNITSLPYLTLSIEWLKKLGIQVEATGNQIKIHPKRTIEPQTIWVESDWSSASYFYSLAALSEDAKIKLNHFHPNSWQGDSRVKEIYAKYFGVETRFQGTQIYLTKKADSLPDSLELNLNGTPDLAPTIAVTCGGLRMKCKLTGLGTLAIKETDRLAALRSELAKIGTIAETTSDSLEIIGFKEIQEKPVIQTYDDHRMAMAFAPLCLLMDLEIENPQVTQKSYPGFWNDLEKLF